MISITENAKDGENMIIKIDFESDEAIYIQLRNQIIMGIATDRIHEGDSLPSVRQLAENIGINMHTVNKAYTVLKQEGYIKLDRRRGAVIALDIDKIQSIERLREELSVLLARSVCKNISREEVHDLVHQIMHFLSVRIYPERKCMIWWTRSMIIIQAAEVYRPQTDK